jgi:Ca2+-binding RTX toxin-like protein
MNMISTGAFQSEMDSSKKQEALVTKLVSAWEKKNAKIARAGGMSLMALSLAACGSSDDTASTPSTPVTPVSPVTPTTTVKLANDGGSYSLTTTVDGVSAPSATSAKIYINDNEPGDAYAFTLDASSAGSGALVIEFADAGDTLTLSADSDTGNFTALEIKNGTVDITALTGSSVTSVTINSGLKATAAQIQTLTSLSGTGDVTVVASTQAEIDAVIAHFNTNDFAVSTTLSAASGSTLTAADLTAANTNMKVETDSNVAVVTTPVTAGVSKAMTTTTDSLVGGAGDDAFTGVFMADAGTGTTIFAGDSVTGGAGVDTLTVSVAGTSTASRTISAVSATGVEKIMASNFDANTNDAHDTTINTTLMSGVTTVGLSSSNATGDTIYTGMASVVDAEMSNGSGDLALTHNDAAVVGTADSATLTVNSQTAGTFSESSTSAGGLETLNVVSTGTKNTVDITSTRNTISTVNISGDQNLTSTLGSTALRTVDGSTATGKLDITTNITAALTKTGGSANDTFTFSGTTYTNADTVDGKGGDDILEIGSAITAVTGLKNVSNVETLKMSGGADVTIAGDANVMNFDFTETGINILTLNSGVTGAVTATVGATGADQVLNTANTDVTVKGTATAIDTVGAITGGTKTTDAIEITADTNNDAAINLGTRSITAVETITAVDNGDLAVGSAKGAAGMDINITTGAYATALTIDGSALDAANADNSGDGKINDSDSSAEKLTVDGSSATAALTLTGGGAGDTLTGGSGNDTINGGDGDDSITATAGGNDTVNGGAGKDTITFNAALTKLDVVDGGDGVDTLVVTALSADALAGVKNIENLSLDGNATLAANLAFTTIDLSNAGTDTVTFNTGYTNATTVKVGAGDAATNSAKIAMTVTGAAGNLESADSTSVTGNATTKTDAMTITAESSKTVATSGRITNVNSITVADVGDASTGTKAAGSDLTIDLASYGTALTIDASALEAAGIDSNSDGKINNSDASAEILTITGTSAKALTVTGGGAGDTIIGSSDTAAGDTLTGGAGDDTFTMATNMGYQDIIDGGTGTKDTITVTVDQNDVNFMSTTNVEILSIDEGNTSTNTLGAYFTASKIATVNLDPTHVSTIAAAGTTSGVRYVAGGNQNEAITAGTGDDFFRFAQTATLTHQDVINGGAGTDTIEINNISNTNFTSVVDLQDVTKVEVVKTIDANGDDTTTAEADTVTVTINHNNTTLADNATDDADVVLAVDGSSITDTLDVFTVNASAISDVDYMFNITGGAAADVLTGGGGVDTISGGSGADVITGGVGADTLTGGAGADDYAYVLTSSQSTNAKMDTITDFATASDEIRISLTLASAAVTHDFTDKGDVTNSADAGAKFSSVKGQYVYNTAAKTILLDTDGNGLIQSTDFAVNVGLVALGAADVSFDVTTLGTADTVTTGGGNDKVTAAVAADSVTTGAGNDTISIAGVTYTGTLAAGTGTDTLQVTADSADVSGATVSGISAITLADDDTLTVSAAQAATFGSTASFSITGVAAGNNESISATAAAAGSTIDLSSVTFTNSNAILLGGNGADTLTAGSGNDYLAGGTTNDVDTHVGGLGNDSYSIADAGEADVIVEAASGGTDTLVMGTISAAGFSFGTTTGGAAVDAAMTEIEQIVITANSTATFDDDQLDGQTMAVNGSGAGTSTLTVTADTGGASIDMSNFTVAAVTYTGSDGDTATGTAFDGNDIFALNGNTGADTIKAAAVVKNNITAGAGDDTIVGNSGVDTIIFGGIAGSANGSNTITGFTVGTDSLTISAMTTGTGSEVALVNSAGSAIATTNTKDYVRLITTDGTAASIVTSASATLAVADMTAATLTNLTAFLIEKYSGNSNTTDADSGVYIINLNHSGDNTKSYMYQWDNDTTANKIQAAELTLVATITSADLGTGDSVG